MKSITFSICILMTGLIISCSNYSNCKCNIEDSRGFTFKYSKKYANDSILAYHIKKINRRLSAEKEINVKKMLNDSLKYYLKKSNDSIINVIPDATTACNVAYLYLVSIYGEKRINNELPLNVNWTDNYWRITGTIPEGKNIKGGTAYIILKMDSGQMVSYFHEM